MAKLTKIEAGSDRAKPLALTCELQITAAADGDAKKLARFSMVAYTGGPMTVGWWDAPVVVDLAGMAIPAQPVPIRLQHDSGEGVGHTTRVAVDGGSLVAEGVISRATDAARDVAESARNGFPWQASIGASVKKYEFVKAGQAAVVNGREVAGPVYVMRQTALGEISFVDLGADAATSVSVAANKPQTPETQETQTMPEKNDTEVTAAAPAKAIDVAAETRAKIAAELERCAKIQAAAKGDAALAAKAIAENWSPEKVELEVLRAERPNPAVNVKADKPAGADVIAAAIDVVVNPKMAEKHHKPEALQAASEKFRGRMSLHQAIYAAAVANGYGSRYAASDIRNAFNFAFHPVKAGGFSNVDLSGILAATANKRLLTGFNSVSQAWRAIAGIRNVSDFKTVTSYRMTGDGRFAKVAPGGEITHGTLSEESFTNKADTYGRMLALTRQDIINDDLGALDALPAKMGADAARAFNYTFWTEFVNNSAFFTSGSYISGASTVLSSDGLSEALTKFRKMTDADGNLINAEPRVLLVPPELEAKALALTVSVNVNTGGAATDTAVPNANIWGGKYRIAVAAELSDSAYTGYSTTAWYLLADPMVIATIEACFLNGVQVPTIETADTDFNVLGVQMRGYFDFGVNLQDKRGGVKSKGGA